MEDIKMFSALDDLDVAERELIFCTHSACELMETRQIDFYTLCKHIAHGLRYKDPELQDCLEYLRSRRVEERYFNAK